MKHTIIKTILGVFALTSSSTLSASNLMADSATTEVSDTLSRSKKLDEVVVEAKSVYEVKNGMAYVPSKLNAETAADAFMLLNRLPISDVVISGASVSSRIGEKGVYYVDGLPANYDEVNVLLPKDIKRVEILRRPTGGAYMGEPLVVNIVTRKFDFGGYSILTGSQKALMMMGDYNALGKFVNGKSTFQFKGGTGIIHTFGNHGSITESYDLTDLKTGENVNISRYSKELGGSVKQYTPNAGFQWNKNNYDDKWNMILRVGYRQWDNAKNNSHGVVKDFETPEKTYSKKNSSNYISSSFDYMIWWRPDDKSNIRFNVTGGYSNNKLSSDYTLADETVGYQNKEDVWHICGNIAYHRKFKYDNIINLYGEFNESFFNATYTGTGRNNNSKFRDSEYLISANYIKDFNLPSNSWVRIQVEGQMPIWVNHLDESKNFTQVSYVSELGVYFGINQKHSIACRAYITEMQKPLSYMTRQPEMASDILTLLGNQNLKNNGFWSYGMSYGIYPTNWFNANVSVTYRHDWNLITNRYFAYEGNIYSQPINSLTENACYINAGASFDILNRSLSIKPNFMIEKVKIKGLLNDSYWNFIPSLSVYYMHKSGLSASLSYSAPKGKNMFMNGDRIQQNYNHSFTVGISYVKNNFSGSLSISPFYKYAHYKNYTIQTGVDKISDMWSRSGGRSIYASLRYTIDFGRRYPHSDNMDVYSNRTTSF